MTKILLLTVYSTCLVLLGCSTIPDKPSNSINSQADSVYGRIEIFDTSMNAILDSTAVIQRIGTGFEWAEGPVWVTSINSLLFSDVIENRIFKWNETDSITEFLFPSGYTDSAPRDGENGSNGLTLDWDGRLLLCQSGNRHVSRLDAPLNKAIPVFNILSSKFNGKKFNSPNDLVTDGRHNIYFTDPVYGLPKQATDPSRELNYEGVYKIDSAGNTTLLIDTIPRPNGVALSPDQSTLYIASSDADKPRWYAYTLNKDRNIESGGILFDAKELKENAMVDQGPDGMKVDDKGNLYCSGPDGINVLSPQGKRLALIRIFSRRSSNCAFNESKNTLFITADDMVFRVVMRN